MTSFAGWSKDRLLDHIRQLEAERSVEAAVLAVIEAWPKPKGDGEKSRVSQADRARAELALSLAREIDSPSSDKPAQVSKELRALLDDLEAVAARGQDRVGVFPSLGHPSTS